MVSALAIVSKQHLQNSQANKKERQLASTTVANVFLGGLLCFSSLSNFSFTTIQLNNRRESLSLANRLVMQ